MQYQFHPSKEAEHTLEKEFTKRTFCLLQCAFSFLFLQQMCALQYTPHFNLNSNTPGTISYTSLYTSSLRCVTT